MCSALQQTDKKSMALPPVPSPLPFTPFHPLPPFASFVVHHPPIPQLTPDGRTLMYIRPPDYDLLVQMLRNKERAELQVLREKKRQRELSSSDLADLEYREILEANRPPMPSPEEIARKSQPGIVPAPFIYPHTLPPPGYFYAPQPPPPPFFPTSVALPPESYMLPPAARLISTPPAALLSAPQLDSATVLPTKEPDRDNAASSPSPSPSPLVDYSKKRRSRNHGYVSTY